MGRLESGEINQSTGVLKYFFKSNNYCCIDPSLSRLGISEKIRKSFRLFRWTDTKPLGRGCRPDKSHVRQRFRPLCRSQSKGKKEFDTISYH